MVRRLIVACISRLLVVFLSLGSVNSYDFVREYAGASFFDGWDFYGSWDNLTLGDTWWVNENDAFAQGLAFINQAGHAVIRVDNNTNVPFDIKRNSVRITTEATYNFGSLWIIDLIHVPFGCSVWPAFWSFGANWPEGGEIDIVEAVNLMTTNQISLHTIPGCVMNSPSTPQFSFAQQTSNDCSTAAGCTIEDLRQTSYGAQFAANGGGVWATQFDVAGINVWFWPRNAVPSTILNTPLDVSTWGVPTAWYPNQTSCPITQFFTPQQLVLDITLCGVWAGLPVVYGPACGSIGPTGTCYQDSVIGPGQKFNDAYFEISYLRTFTTAAAPSATGGYVTPLAASGQGPLETTSSQMTSVDMNTARWLLPLILMISLALFVWN